MTLPADSTAVSLLDRRSEDRRARQERRRGAEPSAPPPSLGTQELCHDLRQPLATASVLAQVLQRENGLSDVGQERLELLRSELARLAGMVTAHLETPRVELVDLPALAMSVLRSEHAASVEDVEDVELVTERTAPVVGDPVLLSRLLANLLTNARAAAGAHGHVRLTVGQRARCACIVVEDSGQGRDPSVSSHGLGLMIVDAVARRHDGRVQCAPSELGGLQITVQLSAVLGWQPGEPA